MNQEDQNLYNRFTVIKSDLQKWKLAIEEYLNSADEAEKLAIKNQLEALLAAETRMQTLELGWSKVISSSSDNEAMTDNQTKGRKIQIQQIGDPKTVKPEYKGSNFDYQANAEKIEHYNNNLTDGGHYYGSDYKIKGMVFLYKQPTHEATYRVVCRFANAAQINAWNDKVGNFVENVNTGKSIAVGVLTTFIPIGRVAKWVGMGVQTVSGLIAGSAAILDNKFLSISPQQVGLSPKYQLTTQSKIRTIRSTQSGNKYNGVEVSISIRVETLSGKLVEEVVSHKYFRELDPFGNSKFDRANDQVLRMFEEQESYEEIVGPDRTFPYLIEFTQRD